MASYPAASNSAYVCPITSGVGRDVLTRRPARKAPATSSGRTSDSGRLRSSMTTCNGMIEMSARAASAGSRDDVESVTIATPGICSA